MIEMLAQAASPGSGNSVAYASLATSVIVALISGGFAARASIRGARLSKEADNQAQYVAAMREVFATHELDFKRKDDEIARKDEQIDRLRTRVHDHINREQAIQGTLDLEREYWREMLDRKDKEIDALRAKLNQYKGDQP